MVQYRSTECIFCNHGDKYQGKIPSDKLISVKTMVFQDRVREACTIWHDSWSDTINARMEYVQDPFAVDAVYHLQCSTIFRTERQIPQQFISVDSHKLF